jgi:uncharacterized membrane protein
MDGEARQFRQETKVRRDLASQLEAQWNLVRSAMELERVEQEAAKTVLVLPRIGCGFRRTTMKKLLMLAAAASLAATMANAQTTVTTTGAAPTAVQIEPQYRTKIKT